MAECELSPIVRRFRLPTVHPFVSPRVFLLPLGLDPMSLDDDDDVCMYACVHVCIHVCMYACIRV